MKKLAAVILAVGTIAGLTACSTLEDAAKAKEVCHEAGGIFNSWQDGPGAYYWHCDLDDRVDAS